MKKLFVITLVFMFLTGCMAKNFTTKDMVMHSSGVNYAYDLGKDELIIYVSKSKYQFIPDALAVIEECKSAVGSILNSVSTKENIQTEALPTGGIQVTSGRNGVTGMTSCTGKAIFKKKTTKPKTIVKTEPKSQFSNQPINMNFKSITKRPDDIAVIIGNANYEKQGKDIPNVNPAYADAEGIKQYFMQALGVKEGNIIYLKDATAAQLLGTFGDKESHKGQLYNWVKPQVSNIYVYYAGHGVPGGEKGNAYLVPTDANSQTIEFSGYPLSTLYSNLGKLSAKSITVILEACFSGASQAGNLFANSSPIVITAKNTMIPKNVKVISAGAVDQMASWEKDKSHGLFTKYFLKAMSGEGDKNNDGKVSDTELKNYLGETMTYYARRYYGRDQNVQIMQGN
ncbi:caspase family protein [Alphaproteobacteria bacterium]|nr:caspase family protein [Alphaproteobacteria bacterium]